MIKVSIYARSGDTAPAGYYRIYQYLYKMDDINYKIRPLVSDKQFLWFMQHRGNNKVSKLALYILQYLLIIMRVTVFVVSDIIRNPKFVVVSRVFVPKLLPFPLFYLIRLLLKRSKLIWDFDDHILNSGQISLKVFNYLTIHSEWIIVIHEFLQKLIPEKYQEKVILLPTTDGDTQAFVSDPSLKEKRKRTYTYELRLVWLATSSNLPNLKKILPTLDIAASLLKKKYSKQLVLTVICNLPLEEKTKDLKIRNIKWTHDVAIEELKEAHVGIMPLINSEFAKGKGGFKLIQYMAIGLPLIGSNVGFNGQIIDSSVGWLIDDEILAEKWSDAILCLGEDWQQYDMLSKRAYRKWEEDFSYERNLNVWKQLLQ